MASTSSQYSTVADLIQGIRANRLEASGLLFGLLNRGCFTIMLKYFSKRGFDEFSVQILFDEGVAIVERKIKEGKFPVVGASSKPMTEQMNAYLMQVVKYLGMKRQKTIINHQPLPLMATSPQPVSTPLEAAAFDVVREIGEECRIMILGKCVRQESWKQIAEKLGHAPDAKKLRISLNNCLVKYLSKLAIAVDHNANKRLLEEIALTSARDLEEPCATIIKLFYTNVQMADIAQKTGFKDANTLKNKKYECMRNLNILITEKLLKEQKSSS